MKAKQLIKALQSQLAGWHFAPYGNGGAVACYPPQYGQRGERYNELNRIAPITAVCGPLYVVSKTW